MVAALITGGMVATSKYMGPQLQPYFVKVGECVKGMIDGEICSGEVENGKDDSDNPDPEEIEDVPITGEDPKKCKAWEGKNTDNAWLDSLPACPCSVKQTENVKTKDGDKMWEFKAYDHWDGTVKKYHPGAKGGCVRSIPEANGSAQQCCYDARGGLLTHGAGAGTPDKDAADGWPFGYDRGHIKEDVDPHDWCGWQRYNQTRKPNNKNSCNTNP